MKIHEFKESFYYVILPFQVIFEKNIEMKKILIFCCVLFVSFSLKAQSDFQPGYVIKNNDDTLKGFIDLRNNEMCSKKCIFKEAETNQSMEFLPGEIKAYRFIDGKYYLTKTVTIDSIEGAFFLEFLVEGKANLYFAFLKNEEYFFIEKENAPLFYMKKKELIHIKGTNIFYEDNNNFSSYAPGTAVKEDNTFKGALIYYLQEYPEIRKKVYSMVLDQKSLVKIAVDYHNHVCEDEKCIVYAKNLKTIYSLGPQLGINTNKIFYDYAYGNGIITESAKNSAFCTGINLDVYSPAIYKRFFGTISMSYTRIEHNTESSNRLIHVLYDNINFSISAYYGYNHYKLHPYAGCGVFISKSLNSSEVFMDTQIIPFRPEKISLAPIFTAGVKYPVSDKFYTKVEYSYQPRFFEGTSTQYVSTLTSNLFATLVIMYAF